MSSFFGGLQFGASQSPPGRASVGVDKQTPSRATPSRGIGKRDGLDLPVIPVTIGVLNENRNSLTPLCIQNVTCGAVYFTGCVLSSSTKPGEVVMTVADPSGEVKVVSDIRSEDEGWMNSVLDALTVGTIVTVVGTPVLEEEALVIKVTNIHRDTPDRYAYGHFLDVMKHIGKNTKTMGTPLQRKSEVASPTKPNNKENDNERLSEIQENLRPLFKFIKDNRKGDIGVSLDAIAKGLDLTMEDVQTQLKMLEDAGDCYPTVDDSYDISM